MSCGTLCGTSVRRWIRTVRRLDGAGHSQELRHYSNTHLIALTLIADNKDGLPKLLDAVAELAAEVHTSFGLPPNSLEAILPPTAAAA